MFEIALAFQLMIWLLVLGAFLASGQASIFHPATVYLGFHAVVFVLRPILVHVVNFTSIWRYMAFQPPEADLVRTLAVTSIALVVFVTVCVWAGQSNVAFPAARARDFSRNEKRALILTTLFLLPLVAYSINVSRVGAESLGGRAANGTYVFTNTTGYITDLQLVAAPLICAWLLVTCFHWSNAAPVLIYIAYRSWCGWARFTIVLFFLMVVLTFCWQRRKTWVPAWALAMALPILVLFNLLGHNRELFHKESTPAPAQTDGLAHAPKMERVRAQLDTQDFANFDYLTVLVSVVPERTGTYTYGAQYLQLFTEPIPRILWKNKPTGAPIRTFDIHAYANFIGLTVSLPGDGWISGGWFGVVIIMGFSGFLLGRFHRFFWQNVNHPMMALFFISALAMIPQWYRDGSISIAKFMLWTWLPYLLWVGITWMLGRRLVPSASIVLSRGTSVRLVQRRDSEKNPSVTRFVVRRY